MAFQIKIETPNHNQAVQYVESRNITFDQLEMIMQGIAFEALKSMQMDLSSHTRTGMTVGSLLIENIWQTAETVALFVGSHTRGAQLRWLDRGRGEVRPKHLTPKGKLGYLRWLTWPDNVIIFSHYSRPTVGIGLMQRAAETAIAQAPNIIAQSMQTSKGVV